MVDVFSSECTGCRACELVCPASCISIREDEEGFIYPRIDAGLCTGCGLCDRRCPISSPAEFSGRLENPAVYAAWNKNKEALIKSASGGIFPALAAYVFENRGVVFGCAFEKDFRAVQTIAVNEAQLAPITGSKYVQSDVEDSFYRAKSFLDDGVPVLYTGTPCQIAGLKSYLNRDYANLITADLICRGVPGNRLFRQYISFLEEKENAKVLDYRFRDKTKYGWGGYGSILFLKGNRQYTRHFFGNYYFYKDFMLRESCYRCKYASTRREGDFTIGDYWGIKKHHPDLYSKNGVSLLMVNTRKAEEVFLRLKDLAFARTRLTSALEKNPHLYKPVDRPDSRDVFYRDIKSIGFEAAIRKQTKMQPHFIAHLKLKTPERIKAAIKKLLKRSKVQ